MQPILIIGSGLAGYSVAREFRKLDQETPLQILSRDDGAFYSKPMLSNALAQGKTAEQLVISSAARMAGQLDAEILDHCQVEAIEPAARRVRSNRGEHPYRQLVLALGADSIRLPIAGDGAADILTVNDRLDYARFRTALEGRRRVAIIGAGLIGCEFADDLLASGHQVSLIDLGSHPLGRLVPEAAGRALEARLSERGADWHLGVSVEEVSREGDGYALRLSDGSRLHAGLVLSAIGLKPRTTLAAAAGLEVGRGIRTDRWLRSSQPDIYAIGDCAEVEGLLLPFVMPIMQGARALARTLAGQPTPVAYPAMPVAVKTPSYPLVVAPPPVDAVGEWQLEEDDDGLRALFRDAAGRLLGFVLGGKRVAEKQALGRRLPPRLD
ncbi:FAD-dependent oxidoreductase [Thiohalobacter sp. IOR34]|uniref:FAD-dependent oxidoreductase n=1 Tax=Thiohalobacter sp. IOR34 TaxID=3057176 RepID=UPI0025B24563|nr:FAD-dependent oxidoreductase [Thiohalobacter sp. IOR34]WJW75612.1 FAD-dependent oxidoreductase [Thiohalobacter sp. IOR34]